MATVFYPNFIENHLKFAREDRILAGKRIKLGLNYSDQLRNAKTVSEFCSKEFSPR